MVKVDPVSTDDSAVGDDVEPLRNNSSSLRRALLALDRIAHFDGHRRGISLSELAEDSGLNKATLLRLLAPLLEYALVQQDPETGRYSVGPRAVELSGLFLERLDIRDIARDVLSNLVAELDETAHLVVLDGLEVVYVDKVEGQTTIRMHSRVGHRQPLYSTAVGKSFLAYAPPSLLDAVVAAGMPARTPSTLTTRAALEANIDGTRALGYAIDNVENELGIRCVGAPIFDHQGNVAAAVSLAGPETRLTLELVTTVGPRVAEAAREISARLGAGRGFEPPRMPGVAAQR
jgi:DNA-binding IclR family transcriptional regulator